MDLKITNDEKHISKTPEITNRYSPAEKEKLAKASRDFESLLTSMMLKSMTKTTSGLFGDESYGGDTFETLFEGELSSYISKNQSLGVAAKLYKKLTGEDLETGAGLPVKKVSDHNASSKTNPTEDGSSGSDAKPIHIKGANNNPAVEPSQSSMNRIGKLDEVIEQASKDFGVDSNIIRSVILAESAGNAKARSVSNAKGLMQLMDSTASSMGVKNVWDPKENIYGGTKYLAGLLRQYNGELKLALAAYNAGPGNVEKYNGVPPFNETRNYISRVMGYLKHLNG
ncbi:MAG: transglycosylase SLT domain-containing protein [Bacteroidota bacterium]|jgi:Rod binding domain-containing protein|nr:transglycosylase SLT domain-containing protein [Ignavibacteria bacterium]HEX2962047.1 transglycosylase SLT domain-containing protein [Ignavibacteriales bacterium]MCU7499361.1 transglycosylase SLT domain-containing protein [Ignavibacteria bacterium]MCU7513489.1 transglycosylase SLT domain-containing protein [Ignavibacteria bacterium]MCU7518938.1 transglycosylase SLT domain-containing protein [Ignavibacteria bacterium]